MERKVTDLVEVFAQQTGLQRNQVEKEETFELLDDWEELLLQVIQIHQMLNLKNNF